MSAGGAASAKVVPVKCTACGLVARAPIVVPLGAADAGAKARPGRCASRTACELRVRRNANRSRKPK
jgi:hypothetical protein